MMQSASAISGYSEPDGLAPSGTRLQFLSRLSGPMLRTLGKCAESCRGHAALARAEVTRLHGRRQFLACASCAVCHRTCTKFLQVCQLVGASGIHTAHNQAHEHGTFQFLMQLRARIRLAHCRKLLAERFIPPAASLPRAAPALPGLCPPASKQPAAPPAPA